MESFYSTALFVQQTKKSTLNISISSYNAMNFSIYQPAIAADQHCFSGGKCEQFGLHFISHPRHALKPSVFRTICAHTADFVISSLNKSEIVCRLVNAYDFEM